MDAAESLALTAPNECPEMDGEGPQSSAALSARHHRLVGPGQHTLAKPSAQGHVGQRALGIYNTQVPGKGAVPMLRTMFTTVCDKACRYCPFGRTRDFRRSSWRPEALARTVLDLRDAGQIEGFFLTSGLATNGGRMMDRVLDTAEILRARGFTQYLHLKLLPGADEGQVAQAMRLADRVSVNLEAPTPAALRIIAPEKDLARDLFAHVGTVADLTRRFPEHRPRAGLVTQFVVGPGGESDTTLLTASSRLYGQHQVRRVYYSGFIPVEGTAMEGDTPTSPLREARLYQADWLLRHYGFKATELAMDASGMLPLDLDPKTAWALRHPEFFPLEVNRAPRELLLRVPGLGPQSVSRILAHRRAQPLRTPTDLRQLGGVVGRAQPFLSFSGKHFPAPAPRPAESTRQLRLFDGSFAFGRPLNDGRRIQPSRGGTYL